MLWTPRQVFIYLINILRACSTLQIISISSTSKEKLEEYLDQISSNFISAQRVRLLLDQSGVLRLEAVPFQAAQMDQPLNACLAKEAINSSNVFLFHKTTQRDVYESGT